MSHALKQNERAFISTYFRYLDSSLSGTFLPHPFVSGCNCTTNNKAILASMIIFNQLVGVNRWASTESIRLIQLLPKTPFGITCNRVCVQLFTCRKYIYPISVPYIFLLFFYVSVLTYSGNFPLKCEWPL